MKTTKLIFLHALTPVHSGTGQAVAVIDLPIAREKTTNWPIIPGSTVKGVFRDAETDSARAETVFGKIDQEGKITFSDQLILFFPVRSYKGTFAYVTCPWALERFKRDIKASGVERTLENNVPSVGPEDSVLAETSCLVGLDNKVYFEDIDLTASENEDFSNIIDTLARMIFATDEIAAFKKRAALVSDDVFTFLCETATVVTARVSLEDDTKTVKEGPWYEEAVPAEAVFYAPSLVEIGEEEQETHLSSFHNMPLQLGGKSTTGRGMCRVRIA